MNTTANRWTSGEDELFRKLVNSRASSSSIAQALNRTEDELKKRGYLLGLPLKWFKTSGGVSRGVPGKTMFAQQSNDYP